MMAVSGPAPLNRATLANETSGIRTEKLLKGSGEDT